ncbi:MAG: calcium/sodium antiporter [Clostridiales bacterium]|nr:calcium/sodium antiporter [Clostridiales bacterium]
MELYISIPLFIVSLILVIKGGDIFVDSSIKIATKTKIPNIIIGATIVSIATTLPELIVSTLASAQGSFDLAIGNAIGSTICNTALICGISLAFAPVIINNKTSSIKNYLLLFGIILIAVFCIGIENGQIAGSVNLFEGALLIILFVVFMAININDAKNELKELKELRMKNQMLEEYPANGEDVDREKMPKDKMGKLILLFILGAGMVAAGAFGLVESATAIAKSMHISEAVIGLTIVAIGTSLPELVTTITALRKKSSSLGYGNVIGANILNITLIIGTSACISGVNGLPINFWTLVVSIPVTLIVNAIFIIPMTLKQRTYRWQGITLLTIYAMYIAFLIFMTANGVSI